jgi:mannose-6-phosphate isomerase
VETGREFLPKDLLMQPLQFQPIVKEIRWGGRRLGTVLGKSIGDANDYAESWEIADCGDDQTRVADGPFRDWTLAQLVAQQGAALFGRAPKREHFPLLIKFLDCNDRLSVQVHPNDVQARQMGRGSNGKTEAWVIIDAEPGSRIYAGLKPGVDRRSLEKHLDAGTVEECLHSFPARRGDCVFVPAGTVHALGEGILLAETQQSSDVTFRLFDWGRLGTDGKPRQLHRAESLACIDFDRGPVDPVTPRVVTKQDERTEELVRCDYFVLRRHTLSRQLTLDDNVGLHLLMPLAGEVDVQTGDFVKRIGLGDTLLVPADASGTVVSPSDRAAGDKAIFIETTLPS